MTLTVTDDQGGVATATSTASISTALGDTGRKSPAANAADSGGDGNGYAINPANAYATDGVFAVDANSGNNTKTSCTNAGKDTHRFYNFGFSIAVGSTIRGLELQLMAKVNSTRGSPSICTQFSWDGGTTWTTGSAGILSAALSTTNTAYTLGGATNTWGRNWGVNDFTNTNFRVRLIDVSGVKSSTTIFSLDSVAVKVYY